MSVRRYVLPSTEPEREQLVKEITDWCAEAIGEARQVNIDGWRAWPMVQLRHTHTCWKEAIGRIRKNRRDEAERHAKSPAVNVGKQEGLF